MARRSRFDLATPVGPWLVVAAAGASAWIARALLALPPGSEHDTIRRPFDSVMPFEIAALTLACVAVVRMRETFDGWMARAPRWLFDVALAVLVFRIVHPMTAVGFHGWPQIQDEIGFDLIGRRIAAGTPVPASAPLPEFFRIRFMVDADGHNYPLFQPGWPLLLAIGHRLHHPGAIPPVATTLLVVAASRLADRFYGRTCSLIVAALLAYSGFLQVIGATYFAHAFAGALALIAIEQAVGALGDQPMRIRTVYAAIAGLASAWLFATRLPLALAVSLPIGLIGLALALDPTAVTGALARPWCWVRVRPEHRRVLLVFFALALLGPIAQLAWNRMTTGHLFELPQDRYFALTEPNGTCHRLGLGVGIGCPREHPFDTLRDGYTFERAVEVTAIRWAAFRFDAWGTPWPLALIPLFFARRLGFRDLVIGVATLSPAAVYFFFYYHGNQYGARFYAELLGPLAIAIVAASLGAGERSWTPTSRFSSAPAIAPRAIALVVLVLTMRDERRSDIPLRRQGLSLQSHAIGVRDSLDRARIHNAVVYVANCQNADRGDVVFGWSSTLNAVPPESGDRIFVRDFGVEHDRQLVALYPARVHWRVDCGGRPLHTIEPLVSGPFEIVSEGEGKFPPIARAHAYAVTRDEPRASMGGVLAIDLDERGAFVRLPQRIARAGKYLMSLKIVRRVDGANVEVLVDGVALQPVLDTRGDADLFTWSAREATSLTAGDHVVELRSLADGRASRVNLDQLRWRRVDE